ncbi:hypothetical protein AGABI2DRAFT_187913 [Agaricus bisporus var. bisporus H97]|uniref:hypothetical protein n=1 Tax=Agaricus bisporus var. bisporus (strain H97 / ATCC MYA-4626 / FGSC 10389) TaxID=936046 RepID=UPI00029F55CF|nr:hypothetical protein AGABI2DRAFT_187913 [Agaricus bisporus var. bisporus H97]EKV43505.1 hypothetical protein AGABI2DRAFT_187913 [Agaricus bisporus var. bisporus H97]
MASSDDVLNLLSVLLECKDPAARDLIAVMGECSSAKEVIIAVQEETEKIINRLEEGEDDGWEDGDGSEKRKLLTMFSVCCSAIKRLKLRKRTASETLQPLLSNLRRAMEAISVRVKSDDAKVLMGDIESMVSAMSKWVGNLPTIDDEESRKCRSLLKSVLDDALVLFRHHLGYDTAQMAFETCFPRLGKSGGKTHDGEGRRMVEIYASAYKDLGYASEQLFSSPTTVSIILFVHDWISSSTALKASRLSRFVPSMLTMLQPTSTLHDDALAFLLLVLHRNQANAADEVSPEVVTTVLPQLIVLSSVHPLPATRHQAFRALSLLLTSGPSQLRLQLLADLVAKCEYPQMRVAAVGLVKDAVLQALDADPSNSRNAFGSAMFMRMFGPLLFRPSPPELFDTKIDLENFMDSPEPKRITEVLSLYYVVLLRDKSNLTGVRDKDILVTIEKNLLHPLASWLATIEDEDQAESTHETMPLVSLKLGLNRIEEAKASLRK